MFASAARVRTGTTGNETSSADHLGRIVIWTYSGGTPIGSSTARYEPYGGYRTTPTGGNPVISDRGFTGHRHNNTGTPDLGLIYMNARYYLPVIGRFISADTLVPEPERPQSFNRYAYALNSPTNFIDPSGHRPCEMIDDVCIPEAYWESFYGRSYSDYLLYIYWRMTELAYSESVQNLHDLNSGCFSCSPPLGADAYGAAVTADGATRLMATADFAYRVRTGGIWDAKEWLRSEFDPQKESTYVHPIIEGGEDYYYDLWGNIVFGYLGRAAGFSSSVLLDGAGVEQVGDDALGRLSDGSRSPMAQRGVNGLRRWDDPRDQMAVQLGVDLWDAFGSTLSPRDLYKAITTSGIQPGVPK